MTEGDKVYVVMGKLPFKKVVGELKIRITMACSDRLSLLLHRKISCH